MLRQIRLVFLVLVVAGLVPHLVHAEDNVEEAVALEPTASFSDAPGPGYLPTPFGWFHKSCVFETSEDESVIETSDGVLEFTNLKTKKVKKSKKCAFPKVPKRRSEEGFAPTDLGSNNWQALSYAQVDAGISRVSTSWGVPGNPSQNGAIVYLFNGMQSLDAKELLQVVLGWGNSGHPGTGNFWTMGSWAVLGNNISRSPLVAVNSVQRITGVIEPAPRSQCSFSDNRICYNMMWEILHTNGTISRGGRLGAIPSQVMKTAIRGALETWFLDSCFKLPSNPGILFSRMLIDSRNAQNVQGSVPWSFFVWPTARQQCNYRETRSSDGSWAELLWNPWE